MRVAVLVTLLVYLAAMLTLTTVLPAVWGITRDSRRAAHSAMADVAAERLRHVPAGDAAAVEQEVQHLQSLYPIVAMTTDPLPAGPAPDTDVVQVRTVNGRPLVIEFAFEPRPANLMRTSVTAAAAAGLAGLTLLGIAAFDFFILFRDLRTGRTSQTASESSRMVATLETSIRTMKGRENELRVLHDRAAHRAAELSTITSTLVRSLTSGFIALDEEGRILDVNVAARELLHEDGAVTGLTPLTAMKRSRFAEALQGAAERREALQRHEVTEPDGAAFGLTTVPLFDDDSRYFGMLALFVDLTPVRQLEHRVREMQSLADLGEMSAGIAHEFRNSLSTVLGYLALARKSVVSAEAEERISRAEEEARQLNGAVASLLAFGRPMDLALQPVELRPLLDEMVEQIRPMAPGIELTVGGDGGTIMGDPLLLKRVAENVLRNAVESVREKGEGGHVRVAMSRHPLPTITVTDDGVGVDPSLASKLFLPFQSTKRDGFGLGLALTRKIVLLHEGTVSLTGAPGIGATLEIRFSQH